MMLVVLAVMVVAVVAVVYWQPCKGGDTCFERHFNAMGRCIITSVFFLGGGGYRLEIQMVVLWLLSWTQRCCPFATLSVLGSVMSAAGVICTLCRVVYMSIKLIFMV